MTKEKELVSGRSSVKVEFVSVARSFLLACIMGGVLIFLGIKFNSMLMAVVGPLTVMGLYIYTMLTTQTDLPMTIIGDSFYYLGFILTLVALVVSLTEMASVEKVNMNSIVGSFGVALMTTIVGLISRIVVTSFSVQGQERRERLNHDIEHALTKFSAQIDTLTNQVISSLVKVHSETEVTLSETAKKYSEVNIELMSYLDEMIKEGSQSIKASMEGVSDRINNIDVSSDLLAKPLGKSLGAIVETLDEHQKNYKKINSQMVESNNSLSTQFSSSNDIIKEHVNNLENSLSKTLDSQIKLYGKSLDDIGSTIIEQFGDIKDLKIDAQNNIENQLSEFNKNIKNLSNSMSALEVPISDATKNMTAGGNKIADKMNKLVLASDSITSLIESASSNTEQVVLAQDNMGELAEKISAFSKELENASSILSSSSEKINSVTNATEYSASQVASDIAEVYKTLANQIKSIKELG